MPSLLLWAWIVLGVLFVGGKFYWANQRKAFAKLPEWVIDYNPVNDSWRPAKKLPYHQHTKDHYYQWVGDYDTYTSLRQAADYIDRQVALAAVKAGWEANRVVYTYPELIKREK